MFATRTGHVGKITNNVWVPTCAIHKTSDIQGEKNGSTSSGGAGYNTSRQHGDPLSRPNEIRRLFQLLYCASIYLAVATDLTLS